VTFWRRDSWFFVCVCEFHKDSGADCRENNERLANPFNCHIGGADVPALKSEEWLL
jgi:hypothetical protein